MIQHERKTDIPAAPEFQKNCAWCYGATGEDWPGGSSGICLFHKEWMFKTGREHRAAREQKKQSEIAVLRQKIEAEYTCCKLAITGAISGTARHDFINRRYQNIEVHYTNLAKITDEQQAIDIVCEIVNRPVEGK